MARHPLEMMIDRACGLEPGWEEKLTARDLVTLRCPVCKQEKQVDRLDHDLPGTAIVEANCPSCPVGGFEEVNYFRADGTQILGA